MRRFTPQVEEYSIDEAFADITGMRRPLRASYETIAVNIKTRLRESWASPSPLA
jgi:DNA polymerase-4/DNA polymerase V